MKELDEVPGLSPEEMEMLRSKGIYSANQLASIPVSEFVEKHEIPLDLVLEMVRKARDAVGKQEVIRSGLEMGELDELTPRIKTDIPAIDEHIDGGISSGSIIEIYGPQWGGKTLLCTQISVTNHSMGNVLWYDAEGTFREDTVREIAFRLELDPEAVLKKFHVVGSLWGMSIDDLSDDLWRRLKKGDVYLIVIDSLAKTRLLLSGSPKTYDILQVLSRIQSSTDITILFTSKASIHVSGTTGQERESRSGQAAYLEVDYRMMIEPKDEDKRRITIESVSIGHRLERMLYLGYGGLYTDNRSMKLQKRRVKRYLKRLREGKNPIC